MPKKPVIFLSFANSSTEPLDELTQENKAIYQMLVEGALKDQYFIHQDSHTSIESLFYYLNRFANRIFLFHFAGHANPDHWLLQKKETGAPELTFMEGVLPKLAQQNNLLCVFLNGCSTRMQAESMLELGIPVIIGTNSTIEDAKAREFATQFYQALAAHHTIAEAFDSASGKLKARYHPKSSSSNERGTLVEDTSPEDAPRHYRDIVFDFDSEGNHQSFSWHLFYLNGSDAIHQRLPVEPIKELKIKPLDFSANPYPDIDKIAIDIFNEMLHYEPNLYRLLEESQKVDIQVQKAEILKRFPSTTDYQLQALFHMFNLDLPYLHQLIKTLDALVELILYAALSQLWDYKHLHRETTFPESLKVSCQHFFTLSKEQRAQASLLPLLEAIYETHQKFFIPYFIEETGGLLKDLYQKKGELYENWIQLEQARERLGNLRVENLPTMAKTVERLFASLFVPLVFSIRYKLIAINEILIRRPRHQTPVYDINCTLYNNRSLMLPPQPQIESYNDFTDDQSVILIREIDNLAIHLNLTPFVIDKNVLECRLDSTQKYRISALYFYDHFDSEKNAYVYKNSTHHDSLEITSEQYAEIWKMMENFKTAMLA